MHLLSTLSLLSALILGILLPTSMTCAERLVCCCVSEDSTPLQKNACCQQSPQETKQASCDNACAHETPEFYPQATQSSVSSINFFELRRFREVKNLTIYSDQRLSLPPKILSFASTALVWCSRLSIWRLWNNCSDFNLLSKYIPNVNLLS